MEKFTESLVVLAFLAVSTFARVNLVHLEMHEEELQRVFSVPKPEAVPEYDIVSLQLPAFHRRTSDATPARIRLSAFGKNLLLWLHPSEGTLATYDTPVYLARTTRTRVYLHNITDAMSVVGKMLEDRRKRATFIVERSVDGRTFISGYVGSEGWTVRPLPHRFNGQACLSETKYSSSDNLTSEHAPHPHVIFHSTTTESSGRHLARPIEIARRRNASKTKRAVAPNIVYPQILVITDHATFQRHGKIARLLEYLLAFWNAVDLRYRDLKFPKVRLNIAGIIIAGDSTALSYVARNKVSTKKLNVVGSLADFGKFVSKLVRPTVPFPFDVAFTLSPLELCELKDSYCMSGTLGYAYDEGACAIEDSRMDFGVALIQDKGAFDGVQTAAHELGHLSLDSSVGNAWAKRPSQCSLSRLGAHHDGAGETPCSSETGNIMAATPILTAQSQDWSNCSLIAFNNFFNSDASACLSDEPQSWAALDRILPGSLMSLDEQCKRLMGTRSCTTERDPCVQLSCFGSRRGDICEGTKVAAADGTVCGEHKICLHERCVDVAESGYIEKPAKARALRTNE